MVSVPPLHPQLSFNVHVVESFENKLHASETTSGFIWVYEYMYGKYISLKV